MADHTEFYRLNYEERAQQFVIVSRIDGNQWGIYRQAGAIGAVRLHICVSLDEAFAYASALVDDPCDSVIPA